MPTLTYYFGSMETGKSTLALQIGHNYRSRGRHGLLLSKFSRGGAALIESRLGISAPAIEVTDEMNLFDLVLNSSAPDGRPVDHVVCDEVQFFSSAQVEQLAATVDHLEVEVHAFGIATDFRSQMFPGSQRMFELADVLAPLQARTLCWCGQPGQMNTRVIDGQVIRAGEQVLVGDTGNGAGSVYYQVLCRKHYFLGELAST